MDGWRAMSEGERGLLGMLLSVAGIEGGGWSECVVESMPDGGMGSFWLDPERRAGRGPVKAEAEVHWHDADGMLVLGTLFLDKHGRPAEVDVWKVDNTPLLRFPAGPDDLLYAGRM